MSIAAGTAYVKCIYYHSVYVLKISVNMNMLYPNNQVFFVIRPSVWNYIS